MLSRLENDILGNEAGLKALEAALTRSTDTLLKRKNKKRLIIDLDSTEDPAHGKQEGVAFNGYFAKNCFHPVFCFTSEGDCLRAKLRPGNVHSADGALPFITPLVERYRPWFRLFWLRGDAAFAKPEIYEYCEEQRITYFIGYRPTRTWISWWHLISVVRWADRPRAAFRSRSLTSTTRPRVGAGLAG